MENDRKPRILSLLDSAEKDPDRWESLRLERDIVLHRFCTYENFNTDVEGEHEDGEVRQSTS